MTKAVLFDELGGPDVLQVRDVTLPDPRPGEVRIRVDAFGLNRAEGLYRMGVYYIQPPLPGARIGYEASGVVEAVGDGVTGFAPGDAVSTLPAFHMTDYGVYGEAAIVPASALVKRPEQLDAVGGAAVWMSFLTAYGALVEFAKIRPGDVVLVTAAPSALGLAAIQVANHLGAIPIATTRSSEKEQQLRDHGAALVVNTATQDLVEEIARFTGTDGRVVDIAYDAINGPMLNTIATVMAPAGTLICYGWLGGEVGSLPMPPAYPFSLNIRIYEVFRLTMDPVALARGVRFVEAGLRSGAFTPVVDRTFGLDDVVEAHRYMEAGKQFGKIVVTVDR